MVAGKRWCCERLDCDCLAAVAAGRCRRRGLPPSQALARRSDQCERFQIWVIHGIGTQHFGLLLHAQYRFPACSIQQTFVGTDSASEEASQTGHKGFEVIDGNHHIAADQLAVMASILWRRVFLRNHQQRAHFLFTLADAAVMSVFGHATKHIAQCHQH